MELSQLLMAWILLGFWLFWYLRKKAPPLHLAKPSTRRYYLRLLGGMMAGAFISLAFKQIPFGITESLFEGLHPLLIFVLDASLYSLIFFLVVLLMFALRDIHASLTKT
ncbi:hypothetical protein CWE21_10120 [Pseudidiomarina aquimaris]|uniref:Uncharacterized protein n=1 Tax=Pseudidiomarina aquimaris TaxID=641841 RepID=A0A432XDX3_9GAMM|nr:hypothetical protein [Pseudidiomarina aquimaris]RUO46948.1 hypothetical protein CWE21_10120 [Pseudidiomarina aquimaris]